MQLETLFIFISQSATSFFRDAMFDAIYGNGKRSNGHQSLVPTFHAFTTWRHHAVEALLFPQKYPECKKKGVSLRFFFHVPLIYRTNLRMAVSRDTNLYLSPNQRRIIIHSPYHHNLHILPFSLPLISHVLFWVAISTIWI